MPYGFGTLRRLVPPMFFTVPPTPTFRIASVALLMSWLGTCSTFCFARLDFNRAAAFSKPALLPLRSTSVARLPLSVFASSRLLPDKGTSVCPPEPAALRFAFL